MINMQGNFQTFHDEFMNIRPDNFTYDGLWCLFNYLNDFAEDMGEPYELDVIGLCCDFSQYTLEEFKEYYSDLADEDDSDEDWLEAGNDLIVAYDLDDDVLIVRD